LALGKKISNLLVLKMKEDQLPYKSMKGKSKKWLKEMGSANKTQDHKD